MEIVLNTRKKNISNMVNICIIFILFLFFSQNMNVLDETFLMENAEKEYFNHFEICEKESIYRGNNVTILKYKILKRTVNHIDEKQISTLFNKFMYSGVCDVSMLDFYDGTGIVYDRRKKKLQYCLMNNDKLSVIDDVIKKNGTYKLKNLSGDEHFNCGYGIAGVTNVFLDIPDNICNIDELVPYLLKLYNSNYLVIFSINDEGTNSLNIEMKEILKDMGFKTDFNKGNRKSFIGIYDGCCIYEDISKNTIEYKSCDIYPSVDLYVRSSGFYAGADCSICVNGKEYSINSCGMNIVVYDKVNDRVVDSVCFNTYRGLQCVR
ncbi:hypothetical protein SAMN05216390_1407 [Lachnospiraceae bacterium KH1T2]|nr:hypothetical protein SAMN05216390_1407 [Lachnospiraceae bacterium KH1T2]